MSIPEIGRMIAEWQALRSEISEAERAEHPDVVDHHGRSWSWIAGDLYQHCGMAWPLHSIQNPRHGLPSESVRNNPNYDLCDICKGEKTDAS